MKKVTWYTHIELTILDEDSEKLLWQCELNELRAAGFEVAECKLIEIETEDRNEVLVTAEVPDNIAKYIRDEYTEWED